MTGMRSRAWLVAAAFVVATAGCSGQADPQPHTASGGASETPSAAPVGIVTGTVDVEADFAKNVRAENTSVGGPCVVSSGYDDQATGAQVVVSDAAGKTIGLGALKEGTLAIKDGSTKMFDTFCRFVFVVPEIPRGEGFYGVATGNRDSLQYDENELFDAVHLTLGNVPGS